MSQPEFVFDPKRETTEKKQGPTKNNEEGLASQVVTNLTYDYCYYPIKGEERLICLNCGNLRMESMAGYDDDAYYECDCCAGYIPLHTPQNLESLFYAENEFSNAKYKVENAGVSKNKQDEFDTKLESLTSRLIDKVFRHRDYDRFIPKLLKPLIEKTIGKSNAEEGQDDQTEDDQTEPEQTEDRQEEIKYSESYMPVIRGCFERLLVDEAELPENVREKLDDEDKIIYKFGIVKVEKYGKYQAILEALYSKYAEYFHVFHVDEENESYELIKPLKEMTQMAGRIRLFLKGDEQLLGKFNAIMQCYDAAKTSMRGNRQGEVKLLYELAEILDVPLCTSPNAPINPDGGEMTYCGTCLHCGEKVYGYMSAD